MSISREVRQALRSMRKSPGSSATIVLTLALCMGANTAVFSVVDAVLFRPLPYPEPDRLAHIAYRIRAHGAEGINNSVDGRAWEMIRDHASRFDAAVYGFSSGANLAYGGRVEFVDQQRVSAGFFRVLGVAPVRGREFTPEEDRAGGPTAVILSHRLWSRMFGADLGVLGKGILLKGEPYTVVGVMPASFRSNEPADIWTPLRASTAGEGGGDNYGVIARLRPGVRWAEVGAEASSLGRALQEGRQLPEGIEATMTLVTLQEGISTDTRQPLLLVWSAVGLVLLIGCVNIAGLLLARAQLRRREIATRMALGASRMRVIRGLVIESLALSTAGAVAGLLVGAAALRGIKMLIAQLLPAVAETGIDGRVLLLTGMVAVATALLFGIYPAFEASGVDIRSAVAEGSRGVAGTSRRLPRRLLVAGEVALALVLLTGATLVVRTLLYLENLPPGFDARGVIAAKFSLQDARYSTNARMDTLFRSGLENLRRVPGVESAAVGLHTPYERALNLPFRRVDGNGDERNQITSAIYTTPDYFSVLRIPLRSGREFNDGDSGTSGRVVLVNESFVRRYYKDGDAIGRHLALMGAPPAEIVGIVGDVRQKPGWGAEFAPVDAVPTVYIPSTQFGDRAVAMVHTWFSPAWIVRAQDNAATRQAIQRAVAQADPLIPISAFQTVGEIRSSALRAQQTMATLLGALAGLAVLLSVLGVYGLSANSVSQRTRELGIRIALGADRSAAMRSAAMPGVWPAVAGAAFGLAAAVAASRLLTSFIWGMRATDPGTIAGAAAGLVIAAALASVIPALRVIRLNAADVLRQE